MPGRLERVKADDGGVSVYVDYAHTPDALQKAIDSVKALTNQRTIVVFGCGGDRDATKRSIMGRTALDADFAVVTSDNPRTEDPAAIIADIVGGMGEGEGRYEVVPDRREAIARAIALAEPGDSILIAGKGHEDYQIVGRDGAHFDDREVAAEELERANAFGDLTWKGFQIKDEDDGNEMRNASKELHAGVVPAGAVPSRTVPRA